LKAWGHNFITGEMWLYVKRDVRYDTFCVYLEVVSIKEAYFWASFCAPWERQNSKYKNEAQQTKRGAHLLRAVFLMKAQNLLQKPMRSATSWFLDRN